LERGLNNGEWEAGAFALASHGLVAGAFDAHSEPALVLAPGGGPVGGAASVAADRADAGAEVDIIVYLTTRHFGLASFGALYGGILTALSIGTALGPLGASAVYDGTGNYAGFLWIAVGAMGLAALLLASLPRPPAAGGQGH